MQVVEIQSFKVAGGAVAARCSVYRNDLVMTMPLRLVGHPEGWRLARRGRSR